MFAPLLAKPKAAPSRRAVARQAPGIVHEVLRTPGTPLDAASRAHFEPRFGHDFGEVRLHTDARAAESARAVDALAYTVGRDVVFSDGGYAPHSRQGSKLLAHELAHVVQQKAGASAPVLARQPSGAGTDLDLPDPRSLKATLLKDEKNLDDAALMLEIKLIQAWLRANPSAPESEDLRLELDLLEDEELMRMEKREAAEVKQNQPKEGTAANLIRIAHRGRLEAKHNFWPSHRHLARGTMEWKLEPPQTEDEVTSRRIQIKFTPDASLRQAKVSFVQTVREEGENPLAMSKVDIRANEFRPFYGMDWDPKAKTWITEKQVPPQGYKNQPSSSSDPAAYLYDKPATHAPVTKFFESVPVVPETGETLGALRWSVGPNAKAAECTDATESYFGVALDKFYAAPSTFAKGMESEAIFNVILDGFAADGATLTADQEKQLDPIVKDAKDEAKKCVVVGGFGDVADKDPMAASDQRAQAVVSYLVGKGVPRTQITVTGFGATWSRYPMGAKESKQGGNRRVQIRMRFAEKYWEKDRPLSCDTTGVFEVFD